MKVLCECRLLGKVKQVNANLREVRTVGARAIERRAKTKAVKANLAAPVAKRNAEDQRVTVERQAQKFPNWLIQHKVSRVEKLRILVHHISESIR